MNLRNRRIWRVAATVVLLLALLCSEALASAIPCYINANTKVYNRPWTSAQSLSVSAGLPCYMVAFQGNWALIQRDSVQAFIPLPYLTLANRLTAYAAKDAPLYKSASASSSKILTIPKATTVYIVGRDGSYFRVQDESGSVTGYVQASYLSGSKPAVSAPVTTKPATQPSPNRLTTYAVVDTPLYTQPSTSSSKILTIPKGTTVYVVAESNGYCYVQDYHASVSGFTLTACLSTSKPSAEAPSTPSTPGISNSLLSTTSSYSSGMSNAQKLEYVIYVAQNLYGRPYATDANPPESFDCSRFVEFCFAQAHIEVPANAQTQGYDGNYATIRNASSLRRGDVVCFNTDSSDGDLSDHTGIYLGQGYFIHSSSGAGKVIVSSLVSGYYSDTFSWGRRILG